MSFPTFEKFLYPFLLFLKDGDLTKQQIREKMIDYFKLSDEEVSLRTKSGNTTQLNDRLGWTLQYFRRALFVEIPKNGTYHITQRGIDYLRNNNDLFINSLMEYPEFAEFNRNHKKKKDTDEVIVINQEITPTEQLEQAYESIENKLASDLLSKVLEQTPAFFEHLVVDLLIKMGYGVSSDNSAQVTQLTNDEGIDGIIYQDKLGLDKIYIQAKRWLDKKVGRPEIQQFSGALVGKNANKGVFITTSSFSNDAKSYVKGLQQKIVLIDGNDLAKYMIEYNVGVSTKKIFEIKRIDTDYFEE